MSGTSITDRIGKLDWTRMATQLDENGYVVTKPPLRAGKCRRLMGLFEQGKCFRSTIDMRRLRFGSGICRYFDRPFPRVVGALREHFYPRLAAVANNGPPG